MKHLSNLSQNVRVFMAAVALSVGAAGCASGGSDGTGTAGSGGTAGAGGSAGSSGACSLAQVNTILDSTLHGCTQVICHNASVKAAGLDLTATDWSTKLVGMGPVAGAGGPAYPSQCAGMGKIYLNAGSNPATGLFLDKMDPATVGAPPCGMHMPELYTVLSETEFACVKSFATTLTNP
jgi:hypothetical protein